MRIIGGIWKGQRLDAPEGRSTTRPTGDRVRESLVSSLLSHWGQLLQEPVADFSGARVLDAFAGTGALGLELLSRGADHVLACELDRRAAGYVRSNCTRLKVPAAQHRLLVGDIFRLAARPSLPGGPFDILLLDPPYATDIGKTTGLVQNLCRHGLLARNCLLVHERDSSSARLGDSLAGQTGKTGQAGLPGTAGQNSVCLHLSRELTFGSTSVEIYWHHRGTERQD